MGAFIFKQPNGRFGRWSSVVDDFTAINMTKEEYIVLNVENSIRDSEYTLRHHLRDYEYAVKETQDMIEGCKEAIGYAEDEEERKEAEEEYNRRKKSYKEDLNAMQQPSDEEDKVYDEYYKTLLKLLEALCCSHDKDWELKDYSIIKHPEHMKEICSKLKEILNTIKGYEKGQTSNTR